MADGAKSISLHAIYKSIQPDLDAVESHLRKMGGSSNPLIAEINRYLFQKGGKRIRPALLILSSKLCGYKDSENIFWSALVEIIHTASLIHDDIVDNSSMRRGQDTVHTKWGPNISVLLGDFLYIQSIAQSLKTKNYPLIDILAEVTAQMIEGELIEFSMSANPELSEEIYLEILDKKTAGLFASACQIGGVLAGVTPRDEERLRKFGTNLGLSFQIVDDMLDYLGEEQTLGKPVLTDFREGRITLPLIYALRQSKGRDRAALLDLIEKHKTREDAPRKVRQLILGHGALDYAFGRASHFSQEAKNILADFPRSEPRESLLQIADMVLQRKK